MNWDDLRLFLAVARAERLTAAAVIVGQDATTVSRRLKRLEQELQQRLFEHTPSGHILTEEGARLLEAAERMEAAALAVQRSGTGFGDVTGSIRVSVSEGFGTHVVAPRLADFVARHPRVQVDLIASSGFLNPSRREADLAVMLARPKAGSLLTRKLTDYRLGLYATRAYLNARPPLQRPSQLIDHVLVGYVADQIYAPELRYLAEVEPRLQPALRSSSINAQAAMVESGAGCGILPCFIADPSASLVRVLPEMIDIQRSFWLVVPRDLRGVARVDRFVDWLLDQARALQPILLGERAP